MTAGPLDMSCTKGQAFSLTLNVLNPDQSKSSLTIWNSRMQVRDTVSAASTLIELSTSNGRITHDVTNGRIVLSLSSSETNGLPVGTAVYDLELVSTVGNSVVRSVQGNFTVGE